MKFKTTMIILIAILCAACVFSACAPAAGGNDTAGSIAPGGDAPVGTTGGTEDGTACGTTGGGSEVPGGSGVLVVYFSCTGNTKKAAEKIAALTGGDIYEIVPAEPYSAADLNYNNDDCRANREMNDPTARPAIGDDKVDISGYDTVIIGYPIWWGTMPRIINTFIESCELSGKTVLPFCTSGSSGISRSVSDIKAAAPTADVRDGLRTSGVSDAELEKWLRAGGAIK